VATGFRIAELDDETFQALYAAWLKYALLIFPGQNLTREQQIAFAKRFGPLEFEMTALSNVKEDGTLRLEKDNDDRMKILKGNMGWHADSTYMPVQAKGAVFCAEEVPTIGGHTGWGRHARRLRRSGRRDTRAKIEGLAAYHSLHYSQSKLGHDSRRPTASTAATACHDGPVPLRSW
jgi:alpha-ketoglutarate-dependent taurine dioxygenase